MHDFMPDQMIVTVELLGTEGTRKLVSVFMSFDVSEECRLAAEAFSAFLTAKERFLVVNVTDVILHLLWS